MPQTKSPRTIKSLNKSISQAKKIRTGFFYLKDEQTLLLPNMRRSADINYKKEGGRFYFRPSGFSDVLLESDQKRAMVKMIVKFYLDSWRNMDKLAPEQQNKLKEIFREVPVDTSLVYLQL